MTHDAPRSASAITTWVISFFQSSYWDGLAHPIDIMTPPTIIARKQNIKITVIIIFVTATIRSGNAVSGVTWVVFGSEDLRKLMQLPTNGTFVLRDIHPIALHAQRSGDHQSTWHSDISCIQSVFASPVKTEHASQITLASDVGQDGIQGICADENPINIHTTNNITIFFIIRSVTK